MPKLTDKLAREAAPRPSTFSLPDTEIRGFRLRITPAGARTWTLRYTTKTGGHERSLAFGGFPAWSAAQAREKAKELRRRVDEGGDPLGELEERRAAPTIEELVERYEKEHLPTKRPRGAAEDRGLIRQWVIPELGKRKVADIARRDIQALHKKVAERTSTRANRVLALLSKLFALSIQWEYRSDNPVAGVARAVEHARERYLSRDEIGRLMAALAALRERDRGGADAIEMLLLTGARRGEVLSATWDQFDLAAGVWTKPASSTKQNKTHRVPLSPEAVALLRRRLPEPGKNERVTRLRTHRADDFVFLGPGKSAGSRLRTAWAAASKMAELDGVRLHDLRHSFASLLVSSSRTLPEIGALLGHQQVTTTARYSHLLDEPLRAAVAEVGKIVRGGK